jgi:hypothetical protein
MFGGREGCRCGGEGFAQREMGAWVSYYYFFLVACVTVVEVMLTLGSGLVFVHFPVQRKGKDTDVLSVGGSASSYNLVS